MKKNLLLFTDGFPFGEKERSFISTEFEYLLQNFNVSIIALTSNNLLTHELPEGVDVCNLTWNKVDLLKKMPLLLRKQVRCEIKTAKKSGRKSRLTIRRIIRHELIALHYEKWIKDYIKSHKVDLIYTYWCTSATLASVRIKQKYSDLNLKVVARFHGYDLYNDRTEGADWQPFRDEVSNGLDKLVFISETGRNYYINTWQVDKDKCLVSYLGTKEYKRVDANIVEGEAHTIVSCSECKALKRVDLIIDALALLPANIKVNWVHIGIGSEFEVLKQRAQKKLSEQKNITYEFAGWIDHDVLWEFYSKNKAQLFITLSETEGLPISVTESIAMGIPAIATDVGGMKELVNAENGYLVDKDVDVADVASIIEKHFSKSIQDRNRMADLAQKHWKEKFNSNENAKAFIKVLCDL